MKLFIANTTKQRQQLNYRVIGQSMQILKTVIEPGQQDMIHGDMTSDVINSIIDQLSKPAGFLMSEQEAKKHKAFIGLIYSIDKPVKLEGIQNAFEHNDEYLTEFGKAIREETVKHVTAEIEREGLLVGRKLETATVEIAEMETQENTKKPLVRERHIGKKAQ